MSYFCAVIGRHGSTWRALDVDVEGVDSLDELAEHMRVAGRGDGPVLAVIEREDAWFALVRADVGAAEPDGDPRAFVSDLGATERSQYADLLAPVGDVDLDEYAELHPPAPARDDDGLDDPLADDPADVADDADVSDTAVVSDAADDIADDDVAELAAEPVVDDEPIAAWAGDPGLLDDLGVSAQQLVDLVFQGASDPGAVLADLGERCGFDDQLAALR